MWSQKTHDLFYRAADDRIMVASYTAPGDSFLAAKRRPWTEIRVIDSGPFPSFDLAPDGKRFAILMPADAMGEQKQSTQLTFLLNFFDELRRRAPVR
jgi:serine/threonine-protein kinase